MSNISTSIEKWFYAYSFKIQDQFDEEWVEGFVVIPEEPNFFVDPYSSMWKKILGTILYLVQVDSPGFVFMTVTEHFYQTSNVYIIFC